MDWNLFWSAVSALGGLSGTVLGGVALIYAIQTYRESMSFQHYAELDQTYFVILSIAVEHPAFRRPERIDDEERYQAYSVYAFMVWNFLETIYDRAQAEPRLKETWLPIFACEGRLHRAWFERPENKGKFKEPFQAFVASFLGG